MSGDSYKQQQVVVTEEKLNMYTFFCLNIIWDNRLCLDWPMDAFLLDIFDNRNTTVSHYLWEEINFLFAFTFGMFSPLVGGHIAVLILFSVYLIL